MEMSRTERMVELLNGFGAEVAGGIDAEGIADFLAANGVAFLEWYRTEDELPSDTRECLLGIVNCKSGGITYKNAVELVMYFGDSGEEQWCLYSDPSVPVRVKYWAEIPVPDEFEDKENNNQLKGE